ncbi:hypothetical protein BT96DRAFT_927251 [Gymnopus androsaceus JB14]|uniref:MYND-type domain-containing protein n=1 Tax=Gymnopus androsaceus JB14 TaxID=1447944 RepID=A0A6A4GQW4_9AGAR|nr:hypothetical protein BT96DRAFT_927251 [Gymnopus androsaceus JB14]
MSIRLQLLERRALSGSSESNEKALYELCSLGTKDARIFAHIFPTLLRFLSKKRLPQVTKCSHAIPLLTSEIITVIHVLCTISTGMTLRDSGAGRNSIILGPSVREYWPTIYRWCHFLHNSFVESDLAIYGTCGEAALSALSCVSEVFALLLRIKIISLQEIKAIPGAGALMVRVHLCALADYLVSGFSGHIFDAFKFSNDWDTHWKTIYSQTAALIDPRLISLATKNLCRITLQRPLDYHSLANCFKFLAGVVSSSSSLNEHFLRSRSVYFTTHLIRQISKIISCPSFEREYATNGYYFLETWKWSMKYLYFALEHGGSESIVLALNSGLLQALWKVTKCNFPQQLHFSVMPQSFTDLIELISTASIYRSVQKPLERLFDKSPLIDIQKSGVSIWVEFRTLVKKRIKLRYRYEANGIMSCSNPECKSPPSCKVFRCSRCMIAFYCSRLCQKAHWIDKHRKDCDDHVNNWEDGHPRPAEERDMTLIQHIVLSELWSIRPALLQRQTDYRRSSSLPLPPILINFVDFTQLHQELGMKVLTPEEARRDYPGRLDTQLDSCIDELQEGVGIGPIVIVKLLHPGQARYISMTLKNPNFG